jgi:hypothetical protein
MKRYLPLLVGAVLLVVSGVVNGIWTNRWTVSAAVSASCSRLESVPATLGDWQGQPFELDARQLTVAEVSGHLARRYVHKRSGREVNLVLLCGRAGPLSVHQPDVCYVGAGYHLAAGPEKWAPSEDGAGRCDFWMARFTRPGQETTPLRVFWAWSGTGDWRAADKPRLAFGGQPALYKIYISHRMTRPDEPIDEGVGREFLQVLLPELRRRLGPTETDHALLGGGR